MTHGHTSEAAARAAHRRLIIASSLGTAIEWYDFFVYAIVAPLAFDAVFFPKLKPSIGLIVVFSTFAVGFISRPLGGVFFGHFGDKIGRKSVLLATILIMGLSSTAIGLLPGYAAIGIWAPVLLVLLRFLQGLAIGGESIGALVLTMEGAPDQRRGLYASFVQAAGPLGVVGAASVVSVLGLLSHGEFMAWGWRIPFLMSFILVAMGAYMRVSIEESSLFSQAAKQRRVPRTPIAAVLEKCKKATLIAFLVCLAETAYFYLTTIFAIGYGTKMLRMNQTVLTTAFLAANCLAFVTVPLFGALSDRWGRRPMLIMGLIGASIYVYPFFLILSGRNPWFVSVAIVASAGIVHPVIFAAEASFVPELFETEVRFTGASLGKQVGTVLGGGLAPVIATTLIGWSHGSIKPVVFYFLAMATP
ncbi:MAG: MFS transporter, partial [Terriglobia bacterium]